MQGPNGINVNVRRAFLFLPRAEERLEVEGRNVIGFQPEIMAIALKHPTEAGVIVHFVGVPFSVELEPSQIQTVGPGVLRG